LIQGERKNMKVLVFGGTGMLGHKVWQAFDKRFDTWVTIRGSAETWQHLPFFIKEKVIENVDAFSRESILKAFDLVEPEVVVNCIGIVKKMKESDSPISAITINALLPHWLADLCKKRAIRLIHISTDCVFSGRDGRYTENSLPDPYDLYGRTKLLGEVVEDGSPTDGVPPPGVFAVVRGSPSARWWWMVRGAAYARDDRPGPTEQEIAGFGVLDAGAGYSLTDWLEVSVLGRNLLDGAYFASSDEDAVLAPGRSVQLVLRGRL